MAEDDHDAIRSLFIRNVSIGGVAEESWTEENRRSLDDFIVDTSTRTLVVFMGRGGLRVEPSMPSTGEATGPLCYFLRRSGDPITVETFDAVVQFGTVRGDPVQRMLGDMTCMWAPAISHCRFKEKNVKDGFLNEMHGFFIALTDEVSKRSGNIILYIPMEASHFNPEEAAKDRNLVERMECIVIHWTEQIKELRDAQIVKMWEKCGPLQEIAFWQERSSKLLAMENQLKKPDVEHIKNILQLAKSQYVERFCQMSRDIQDCTLQAKSNLEFLSKLKEPCEELAELTPTQIPSILKHIVNLIRIIWVDSPHFNTNEKIIGLFNQMTNEIIRLCSKTICLDKIFEGYVFSSKKILDECAECCISWKQIYLRAARIHHEYSEQGWVLDKTSFFVVIDTFIRRLTDLIEVCDCQYQFARWEDGQQRPLPVFGSHLGPTFTQSLLKIESNFHCCLGKLRSVDKHILDVNSYIMWDNEFSRFCTAIKGLEIQTKQLMTSVFKTANTFEEGVSLVDIFTPISARKAIKRSTEEAVEGVANLLYKEIKWAKTGLKNPKCPEHMPKMAGRAHFLMSVKHRLQSLEKVMDKANFMPDSSRESLDKIVQLLDVMVMKIFVEWTQTLDAHNMKRLEQPLLVRCKEGTGKLSINFDRSLLNLFSEIHYWERLKFEIPQCVSDIYEMKDSVRILRERVLLLVKDYNRIIDALTTEELDLFREKIFFIDRKIQPSLTKFQWLSQGESDIFIRDCLLHVGKVKSIVDVYKESNQSIANLCSKMSETLLVHLDGKTVYRNLEFEDEQKAHQQSCLQVLRSAHASIVDIMNEIYIIFEKDGPKVQECWVKYTGKVDQTIEEALKNNIKSSLKKLSKAINGDSRTVPHPLFKVYVSLRPASTQKRASLEFSPSLVKLSQLVNILPAVICLISEIKRLPELLSGRKTQRNEIHSNIEKDEEIKKIQAAVSTGVTAHASQLQAYLKVWDKYRNLWEINKDSFIQRYQKLNPSVSSFDADIHRYTEEADSVEQEENMYSVRFVMLDCSPLKSCLVQHCNEWQAKLTELLCHMASTRLQDLHTSLHDNAKRLEQPPQTLVELGESLKLWESLQGNSAATEAQIPLIHEQFAILTKYEVQVEQMVQDLLEVLDEEWVWFQQVLIDSNVMLQDHKEKFKNGLISSSEELKKKVESSIQEFRANGPFNSALDSESAFQQIAEHHKQLEILKQEQDTILSGLGFFNIEQPPSKVILNLGKDIDRLQQVWEITKEWDSKWNSWKGDQFATLQTEALDITAKGMFKKLHKLQTDVQDKGWDIVESSTMKVKHFRVIIPLITELRNPAMRDRHWRQVCEELDCFFDPTSADFTLEMILSLGLDRHADKIREISASSSKELFIEQGLEKITETWDETFLDVEPYKDEGHYMLKNTDDIFQTLEENHGTLSSMKASHHAKAFMEELDSWERQLSLVMEVIETILTVQRHWSYLQNIFHGIDIREQLPCECAQFEDISATWKTIMGRLSQNSNALKGTHHPGLLEKLLDISTNLEEILKALDKYMESKRQIFPRFYFMSNDDILDILGQSQNPEAMQPHLKKCFDNIQSLQIEKACAEAMCSADGEVIRLAHKVELDQAVEAWLCELEIAMRLTLRNSLSNCIEDLKKISDSRDKWVKRWPGQNLITASHIKWTSNVTKALSKETAAKSSFRSLKKNQMQILHCYTEMIREDHPEVLRLKLVALITSEVHARDVIDKLAKAGCCNSTSFDWLCQLRLYWDKNLFECIIRQTNTSFKYGFEYLGNSRRLVITPLTDRCFITLTTALHLHRGGAPSGLAGTGKTETVKDLGKALGMYVLVVNCSEGLDYKAMGRMFSGLAQTGAWGCFDDFDCIKVEVLSVVAQQILSILSALSAGQSELHFDGQHIKLVSTCGFFCTMNSGYAGRTQLPDNLKSMFRPISMVMPDTGLIAHVLLLSEGFDNSKLLAKKVVTLYSLAVQQLSKQDHYDFSLRSLTLFIRYAGVKHRLLPKVPDEGVLLMALKDLNVAKLTSVDQPLFNGIIQDLFPGVEAPTIKVDKLKTAVELELRRSGLQMTPYIVTKVVQLYQTKKTRHSIMLVGKTNSGKSVTWRVLKNTLTALHQQGVPGFRSVQDFPLNAKSMTVRELYGENDLSTNEWNDGILSSHMRSACSDEKPDEKWIVLDGPVDTLWIDSLNSVMDDNKLLTLINGERITVPEQVSLLFEVENLAMASPASVSRCGMVYNDYADLGWKPFVQSWLEKRNKAEVAHLAPLFEKYIETTLNFKRTHCHDLITTSELNCVSSLCRLYDSLATPKNGVNTSDSDNLGTMVDLWFLFSLIWSICASVDDDGRKKMNNFMREMDSSFPLKDSVYDYLVDSKTRTWIPFEEKLKKGWRYNPAFPFYKIIVPTIDIVRYNFVANALVLKHYPVLLTGHLSTGKTSAARSVLRGLDDKWTILSINMSSQSTAAHIRANIERRLEKRTKTLFMPIGGKLLMCFLDDLNMPIHDDYGSQPPLELLRHWMEYEFWFDHQKHTRKVVKNMFLLASMGPPRGGGSTISSRLKSRFNLINITTPSEQQITRIFSTMINQKLQAFQEELKPLGTILTQATLDVYNAVSECFHPTPAKQHYVFNLRDISKVFQGLLRAHPDFHDTKTNITRLWVHECFRVFSDRLVNTTDLDIFTALLAEKLNLHFELLYHKVCPNRQPPLFGDFMSEASVYEDLLDRKALKAFMEKQFQDYNEMPGAVYIPPVLFQDAIEHLIRIVRVISQPKGNMVVVGVGGSGKESLAKIAAFICGYQIFQVQLTNQYGQKEFRDDLKKLYYFCGVQNKPAAFIFSDTQIIDEIFLDDISNILSSVDIPSLYKQDELAEICSVLTDCDRKEDVPDTLESSFKFLLSRVRNNLHIVLCMTPEEEIFRKRILHHPALVNHTTINWFLEFNQDALMEVGLRYLAGLDLESMEGMQEKIASVFVTTHHSVGLVSQKMDLETRRKSYVTPPHYLELVLGYRKILAEKRSELGKQMSRLQNCLLKVSDTRAKVEAMSVELIEAKEQVAMSEKECDECFAVIVQQKREADKQQKMVTASSEKIEIEEAECKALADNAQKDLNEALPALEEALKALESLNKGDMTEIKSYSRPPTLVETVMQAVMTLLGKEPTWSEAKRQLGEANFIKTLVNFDKDNISDRVWKKIGKYCKLPDFQPDIIGKVSVAAKSLCMWVRAINVYAHVYRVVEPKRTQLNAVMAQLQNKQAALAEAQNKQQQLAERLDQLKKQHDEKVAVKRALRSKSEEMEVKLTRADKLVTGLAGERVRWEEILAGLEENTGYLLGDCLLAASFMSYMGPFPSTYRDEILDIWMTQIRDVGIPFMPEFNFVDFLAKPTVVKEWNFQGLPFDNFSTENGLIISRGNRWPLIVDPQCQALNWIQNMESQKNLKVIDFQTPNFLKVLINAIPLGTPVLLQNIRDRMDPSLNPLLYKFLQRKDGKLYIMLGDREVEYNPEFRFYITTKMSAPHYSPDISAKTNIINFEVKEQGLEIQLLRIVVRKERPELEEQKDSLLISIASGRKSLNDLEDKILRLLSQATGSLLDDAQLVDTLHESKVQAAEVSAQLESSEQIEHKVDSAREAYRPCAQRAAILFIIQQDMSCLDPMYQFSLQTYIHLFLLSIDKSKRSYKVEERMANLIEYHTYAVYRSTCRTLFEVHKMIFSFQMTAKIMEKAGKLNTEEYNFFLRGGVVLNKKEQIDNPWPLWLSESSWDNITELDKINDFNGLILSFQQHPREWHMWFTTSEPEKAVLPQDWEINCNDFQKMLIVRSLRLDRVSLCINSFIIHHLGERFVEPPELDLNSVLEESSHTTPLIFDLSPGVDPTKNLIQLTEASGMSNRFYALSMGQGQIPIAKSMIQEGIKNGHWVFIANCHMSLKWLHELDNLIKMLQTEKCHPEFRLWLSSSPHPEFPITILHTGIKMTTEPQKGVKANLKRLYQRVTEAQFNRCSKPATYKKLLFSLCFFHSILLERKKFMQLGWNIVYGFNDADFEMSENLLSLVLDQSDEVPWDALKNLIADINYGGHVTDDWDRRLIMTYINEYFCEAAVTQHFFKLSSLPSYFIPRDGTLDSYKEYISMLPTTEHPELFGQHPNAAVASQIAEAQNLFDTLLALQPHVASGTGAAILTSREDMVLEMLPDVNAKIPACIDYEHTWSLLQDNLTPLNMVLLQEVERYNTMLSTIHSSLQELEMGIQGLGLMTASIEESIDSMYNGRVPQVWQKEYASIKPLAVWITDLCQRVDYFSSWAETTKPPILVWLSAFTSPKAFLIAVLQSYARQHNVSADKLLWDYIVSTQDESTILQPPDDGVFVRGLFLEGAAWDRINSCLEEPDPMQMSCPMPVIYFKLLEKRKKMSKSMYLCPCYYYPVRGGQLERPSFVLDVVLDSGAVAPEHWIKRGTALLLSLDC